MSLAREIDYVGRRKPLDYVGRRKPFSSAGRSQRVQLNLDNNRSQCTRCGRSPAHGRQHCPAREETCHACGKKGHFKTMCRTQGAVQAVESAESAADDEAFMGMVWPSQESNPWSITLSVNGTPVEF